MRQIHFLKSCNNIGLEISGAQVSWKDDEDEDKLEYKHSDLAATLRFGFDLMENVNVYVGGGVSYLMVDGVYLDPVDARDYKADFKDSVGYHGCGGLELKLNKNLILFGEYRHTSFSKLEVTETYVPTGETMDGESKYTFGLVRAGLNLVF